MTTTTTANVLTRNLLAALMLGVSILMGCSTGAAVMNSSNGAGSTPNSNDGDDAENDDAGDADDDDDDGPVTPDAPDSVPDFASATFSDPSNIDHPLFPQEEGTTRTYRSVGGDETEEILIEVLLGTRQVMGLDCRIVRDRVFVDGVLIEDTYDWFAQDDEGNVWYMGEEVTDFNYDDSGRLIDIQHDGAWESGKDVAETGVVALPGIQLAAMPQVGDFYHQEYYAGEAEDTGEVIGIDVPVTLSDGTEYLCIQTEDSSTLEPSAREFKYYAPGIGLVLEEVPDSGERVELVGED